MAVDGGTRGQRTGEGRLPARRFRTPMSHLRKARGRVRPGRARRRIAGRIAMTSAPP
jgi:hypothetical protein